MDIYANELSITEDVFDEYDNIKNLAKVYKCLSNKGFSSCRINGEALTKIYNVLNADAGKRNLLNFIYSFLHAPFDTDDIVNCCAEEYLSHQWSWNGQECVGLAYANIMDSLTLSFNDNGWQSIVHINRDDDVVDTRNVSNEAHLKAHLEWIESLKEVVLLETDIRPENKAYHVGPDHGRDKLKEFSKRILNSPYVVSVINSLRFNSSEKKFIRKVKSNGVIECVLCWTDEGYGLAIQTTGRNLRETEKIAELLKQQYGE